MQGLQLNFLPQW